MKERVRVYVAGKYSAPNVIQVLDNIRAGIAASYEVLKAGYAPFCPWLDFQFALHGEMKLEEYYEYSMAWLDASDAVLVLPDSEDSVGTQAELVQARKLRIPVFRSLVELQRHYPADTLQDSLVVYKLD